MKINRCENAANRTEIEKQFQKCQSVLCACEHFWTHFSTMNARLSFDYHLLNEMILLAIVFHAWDVKKMSKTDAKHIFAQFRNKLINFRGVFNQKIKLISWKSNDFTNWEIISVLLCGQKRLKIHIYFMDNYFRCEIE